MNWTNINDQYPKDGQKVWTYFEHTGINLMKYYNLENTGYEMFGRHQFIGTNGFLTDDVTHWMPYQEGDQIPEKPVK